MNRTTDYEDTNVRPLSNSLQDNWGQVKDTRKYAEVLTKYSSKKDDMLDEHQIFKPAEVRSKTIKISMMMGLLAP